MKHNAEKDPLYIEPSERDRKSRSLKSLLRLTWKLILEAICMTLCSLGDKKGGCYDPLCPSYPWGPPWRGRNIGRFATVHNLIWCARTQSKRSIGSLFFAAFYIRKRLGMFSRPLFFASPPPALLHDQNNVHAMRGRSCAGSGRSHRHQIAAGGRARRRRWWRWRRWDFGSRVVVASGQHAQRQQEHGSEDDSCPSPSSFRSTPCQQQAKQAHAAQGGQQDRRARL